MNGKNLFRREVGLLLEQHRGGEKFFDKLDEEIRSYFKSNSWLAFINKMAKATIRDSFIQDLKEVKVIVVSGKFGRQFADLLSKEFKKIVVAPGGLRHDNLSQEDIDFLKQSLNNQPWVFVDDSFYQGRTYSKIANAIGYHAERIKVFYDGSFLPPIQMESWYRYHPTIETKEEQQ
jgi:hypothetical protein